MLFPESFTNGYVVSATDPLYNKNPSMVHAPVKKEENCVPKLLMVREVLLKDMHPVRVNPVGCDGAAPNAHPVVV
jgi:hypothetical protein